MRQMILRGLGFLLLAIALPLLLFSVFPGMGVSLGNRELELHAVAVSGILVALSAKKDAS